MAETVRKVDYFYIETPDNQGRGVGRQNCVRQEIQAFMGTTAIDPCDINPAL